MAVPFLQYVSIKDKYCISYFGTNEDKITGLLLAREFIEKSLPGLQVYIACRDEMKKLVRGKRNIILESNMQSYRGKVAHSRNLEEKDSIIDLLRESEIPFPEDFNY